MSFATGLYLGLVNLVGLVILRPWSSTILGTVAALVSNNLTVHHLLYRRDQLPCGWIIAASGVTMLCARSWIPTTILEVVPYALCYLTTVALPYFCCTPRTARSSPVPVARIEMSTMVPLPPPTVLETIPEEAVPEVHIEIHSESPHTDDEYDRVTDVLLP